MYNGEFEEVLFAFLKGLNSPRSLAVWILYREGEFEQLVSRELPDPMDYVDAHSFHVDYQASMLLRKAEFLDTGIDRKAVATRKLAASERQCASTNERLRKLLDGDFSVAPLSLLEGVRRKIRRVLGAFDLDEFAESQGWGPGATSSLPRKRATPVDKLLEERISVTAGALRIAQTHFGRDIHWCQARGIPAEAACTLLPGEFQVVKGCKGTLVPKDARSDRFIAIEPTANLFLQKGMGKMIRKRLRRVGVNLDDQTANAEFARVGSIRGDLATLDLSAASDSVSRGLVAALLPDDWFVWLNRLRSPYLEFNGETTYLSKFSSMGNGFTFELETLIFWAITAHFSSVSSVFGDDIICTASSAPEVVKALETFGFSVNSEKSFILGSFRESCGSHYFGGFDVKPIYVKEDPYGSVTSYINFCNSILLAAYRLCGRLGFHQGVYRAWQRAVRDYIGPWISIFNAEDTRDCGVAYPYDDPRLERVRTAPRTLGRGFEGWYGVVLPGLSLRPGVFQHPWLDATLAYTLRFAPEEPLSGGLPVKRGGRYVTRRIIHWHRGDTLTS